MFVGQRIRWTKDKKGHSYIRVDQDLCIDELEEITIDKGFSDTTPCPPSLHTSYRSVLGQINWLQSRTQYPFCYAFFALCVLRSIPFHRRRESTQQAGQVHQTGASRSPFLAFKREASHPRLSRRIIPKQFRLQLSTWTSYLPC